MHLTVEHYEIIEDILDNFDFHKVERVMRFLDWKWMLSDEGVMDTPDVFRIRKRAREQLKTCIGIMIEPNITYVAACGGFIASGSCDEFGFICLHLSFSIEESEYNSCE